MFLFACLGLSLNAEISKRKTFQRRLAEVMHQNDV